jgi:murein DD-endopeptidase MepM/ murein hydrolase activator NlpD
VRTTVTDTRAFRNARGATVALAAACALLVGAAGAAAQSGGVGDPTPPPPPPSTTPSGQTQVFPVPGPHKYGDGWGAGRSHRGVDLFAPCGSDLVAVMNSRVVANATHARAGNYVILRNKGIKRDYVYMHLATRSPLAKGQIVGPGTYVGPMGDTGNASGCHLHFEIWRGKWYRGGTAINPLRSLQTWDAYS